MWHGIIARLHVFSHNADAVDVHSWLVRLCCRPPLAFGMKWKMRPDKENKKAKNGVSEEIICLHFFSPSCTMASCIQSYAHYLWRARARKKRTQQHQVKYAAANCFSKAHQPVNHYAFGIPLQFIFIILCTLLSDPMFTSTSSLHSVRRTQRRVMSKQMERGTEKIKTNSKRNWGSRTSVGLCDSLCVRAVKWKTRENGEL